MNRADDGIEMTVTEGKSTQAGFTEGEYFIFKDMKINFDNLNKEQDKAIREGTVPKDINCLMNNNLMLLGKFTIAADTKSVTQNIHMICDPCMEPRP